MILKNFHSWSDRCGKECSNTKFLFSLGKISEDLKINCFHSFTEPGHGKWLHDSNGSVNKRIVARGVREGKIQFKKPNVRSHADSIKLFLEKEAAKSKSNIKRHYVVIKAEDIPKLNFKIATFNGIKTFFNFFVDSEHPGTMKYRKNTCYVQS